MKRIDLIRRYPPSPPCSCPTCRAWCVRPGWWTVAEAASAIDAGYAGRMMLEMSPGFAFGVLSPAFKGNEGAVALDALAQRGCTFLAAEGCELFATDFRPLECRFCHHSRQGRGARCHRAIEKDWRTKEGQKLVIAWAGLTGCFERHGIVVARDPGVADTA